MTVEDIRAVAPEANVYPLDCQVTYVLTVPEYLSPFDRAALQAQLSKDNIKAIIVPSNDPFAVRMIEIERETNKLPSFTISKDNDWIVMLHKDGGVTVNPKLTLDEAAKEFWAAVRANQ